MKGLHRDGRRLAATLCALVLLAAAATPVAVALAGGGSGGAAARAARLRSQLESTAGRVEALREPAATAQGQLAIVLEQLQQASAPTYDPHYLPALVAAGRAYMAVSGHDPVTGTQVNPEYAGLELELTSDASRLGRAGDEARRLSAATKGLARRLDRAKRRTRFLEAKLRRLRAP
jgi:hypothetical protein